MDYFIIGILGSGTKALASLLIQMGNKVCGVDKKEAINDYKGKLKVFDINYFKPIKNISIFMVMHLRIIP